MSSARSNNPLLGIPRKYTPVTRLTERVGYSYGHVSKVLRGKYQNAEIIQAAKQLAQEIKKEMAG